jgi:hypothetical protein
MLSYLLNSLPTTPHCNLYTSLLCINEEAIDLRVEEGIDDAYPYAYPYINTVYHKEFTPAMRALQSGGGGGIFLTPFCWLVGYTIERDKGEITVGNKDGVLSGGWSSR